MPAQRQSIGNQLLDKFEASMRQRIDSIVQPMDVEVGMALCESGGYLDHAYFPTTGVLSLLTVLEDGAEIETANIGCEGAYGIFNALYRRPSFNRCVVQMQGKILRMPTKHLRTVFESSAHIRELIVHYSEAQVSQIQQSVACNARHSTEKRISRWLLMMNDRAPEEELPYTHEFLSSMLGANRKSVTIAAQALQTEGLIEYRRGKIRIVNRKGLERIACECYAVVRRFNSSFEPQSPQSRASKPTASSNRRSPAKKPDSSR